MLRTPAEAIVSEEEDVVDVPTLPGPPPNPSSIPSVVRAVGNLDLDLRVEELGFSKKTEPNLNAIIEFLNEVEIPEPLSLFGLLNMILGTFALLLCLIDSWASKYF